MCSFSSFFQDIGIYECVASNYLGAVSHRARINQMGAPFVKPISNQTAVLGQPFTINCTYGGYPLEEVYFVKGSGGSGSGPGSKGASSNKRMPFDERHLVPMLGSITISPVERSDQDYYRCIVLTSNGERAEQEFYLNVVGKLGNGIGTRKIVRITSLGPNCGLCASYFIFLSHLCPLSKERI